jgi:hypothetical protein
MLETYFYIKRISKKSIFPINLKARSITTSSRCYRDEKKTSSVPGPIHKYTNFKLYFPNPIDEPKAEPNRQLKTVNRNTQSRFYQKIRQIVHGSTVPPAHVQDQTITDASPLVHSQSQHISPFRLHYHLLLLGQGVYQPPTPRNGPSQ